jgi:hypothetical protein
MLVVGEGGRVELALGVRVPPRLPLAGAEKVTVAEPVPHGVGSAVPDPARVCVSGGEGEGARVPLGVALPPLGVALPGRGVPDCTFVAVATTVPLPPPPLLLGVKEPVALPPLEDGV